MLKSGIITDSTGNKLQGVIIAKSDQNGNLLQPINSYTQTDQNGSFNFNFIDNSFYTFTFIGTKKQTFKTADIPKNIVLLDDNTLDEITITPGGQKKNLLWLIPLILIIILKAKK